MPSPFPGMDPYLEGPDVWPDVHLECISKIRGMLNKRVLPAYTVRVETRVYVSHEDDIGRRAFIPDIRIERPRKPKRAEKAKVAAAPRIDEPIVVPYVVDPTIEEAYLAIRDRKTSALVTVIEILSPANKIPGSEGRKSYMEKRAEFIAGDVHLVEIDLLRAGQPPIEPLLETTDYRAFQSRANERTKQRCWLFNLQDRPPVIGIPLKGGDPDVPLDLGELLTVVYESGAYDNIIDYSRPCEPPLKGADAKWARKLLRDKGLRR